MKITSCQLLTSYFVLHYPSLPSIGELSWLEAARVLRGETTLMHCDDMIYQNIHPYFSATATDPPANKIQILYNFIVFIGFAMNSRKYFHL